MKPTPNFYEILQVEFNADKADIISAYRRLSKLYHPDVSKLPYAEDRMAQINLAYETLRDDLKRQNYNSQYVAQNKTWPAGSGVSNAAETVINAYFESLLQGAYDKAYRLLCEHDKQRVSPRSFYNWRQTVQELYAMRQFNVKRGRLVPDFKTENQTVPAEQFYVDVLEKDYASGNLDHYCFSKYVILEKGSGGVYLGYRDLNEISKMFDFWAREREKSLMQRHWQEYIQNVDRITGLYTRDGLLHEAKKELYRARRYDRQLVITGFILRPAFQMPERMVEELLEAVAQVIKKTLRLTDTAAYIGKGRFIILYPELKKRHAATIIERLIKRVETAAKTVTRSTVQVSYQYEIYTGGSLEAYLERLNNKLSTI